MSPSTLESINDFFDSKQYFKLTEFFRENIDLITDQNERLKAYHLAAKSYYHLGKNKQAFENIRWVRNSIDESELSLNETIDINLDYGRILRRLGKREEAKLVYKEILDHYGDIGDETKATIFHNLANIYLEVGDFGKSSDYFNQALEIDQRTENDKGLSLSYSGLGSLNFYLGKFDVAIEFYLQSLEFRKKTKDRLGEALILLNIGSAYASILDKKSAERYLKESEKIFKDFKHEKGILEVLSTKARMNYNLQDYSAVIDSLKFLEESTIQVQSKEQINLVNILIESMIRDEQMVRAEQLVERSVEQLKQVDLEKKLPLYEEFGKMMQLLSLIKFQLEKTDETLLVLEELERIATSYNDIQSLVVVFFSKANVFYQVDSLEKAESYAKESERLAKRIDHNSLPLILDVLFRINMRLGKFDKCIKQLKQQKRISGDDALTIHLTLNSFLLFANQKIKSIPKKLLKEMNDFQITLSTLQVVLGEFLQKTPKISQLLGFEKEIEGLDNYRTESLKPYFLHARTLIGGNSDVPIVETEGHKIETVYSKTLLDEISEKELLDIINSWKTHQEFSLHKILIVLEIIFFGVLKGSVPKKILKLDCWKDNINESFSEVIEIKQEILIQILEIKKAEDFSFDSKTALGCLIADIFKHILPKIYDKEELSQEELEITLVLLTELIIRTLVMLFVR